MKDAKNCSLLELHSSLDQHRGNLFQGLGILVTSRAVHA